MFLIPLMILFFMLLGNFEPDNTALIVAAGFWVLLLLNSLAFLFNGILIIRDFKRETRRKAEEGFPVESLEGFSAISRFVTQTLTSSSLITTVVAISLLLFLTSLAILPVLRLILPFFPDLEQSLDLGTLEAFLRPLIMFSAIGLVLIAIGILLLLKIPEKPSFEVGAFLKYYYPRHTPIALDNLLSDSILAFLDPITRMRFDEWTASIIRWMREDFEPESDAATRLERARERILLLFYLKKRMPSILPDDVFDTELKEVIKNEEISKLKDGIGSDISFSVLNEIFDSMLRQIPEIFKTIDRLVIELTDNLFEFKNNSDIWVTVSAPEKVVGNINPFRILIFALNKDTKRFGDKRRLVNFRASGAQSHFMEKMDYSLALDEAEDLNIYEDKLSFVSEDSNDILGILSQILQIGDAVWFTIERKSFKSHLFHVSINEENRGSIFGETINVDVTRDMRFYLKTYGGKLSAISGLIIPLFSFFFAF